jgi:hypothetical protein
MADLTTSTDVDTFMGSADQAAMRTNLGLGTAAVANSTDFATAAQGALADTAIQGSTGSNNNHLVRADGTGGKTVKATGIHVDNADNLTGVESVGAKSSTGLVIKTSAGATVATFGNGGVVAALPSSTSIGTVTSTEIGYLSGVTSAIQAQINGKASSSAAITIAGNSTALGGSVTQDQITGLSTTGLVKRTASNTLAIASSGSDYAPATSGTSILKGSGTGGFSNAAAGTDYCAATSGSGILKASGGNTTAASAGTDYVAPGAATSSGLTMATARLLGRTTASSGALEEISIGSGLSLSAGSLSATGSGGGKILQVVQATLTTTANVTGTTFGSVFTASITPSVNTSKVLVMAFLSIGGATSNFVNVRLTKSGTTLIQGDAAGNRTRVTTQTTPSNVGTMTSAVINYLDSPASTSAQTYAIEIASHSTGAVYLNRSGTDTDGVTFSRGSSTIILMEVAA